MSKKILFVVHRYAPYPGGSENYVRDMAEETLSRGHEVCVFTNLHKGDLNGVKVTDDLSVLAQKWDLIVVHGGNIPLQNIILKIAGVISSPVLYLLIEPSETKECIQALTDCKFLGCSTKADWEYVKKHGVQDKSVPVRHGINDKTSYGTTGFRAKYGINTKQMFISCGGYWPNKALPELISVFNEAKIPDTTLVLTGYDNRHGIIPKESEFVKPLLIESRSDVLSGIKEADLYILHSFTEGFGLVLLEAMLNKTPWAARNIAGAETMKDFGFTYNNDKQLIDYLKSFKKDQQAIDAAYDEVIANHLIKNTVDDILKIL